MLRPTRDLWDRLGDSDTPMPAPGPALISNSPLRLARCRPAAAAAVGHGGHSVRAAPGRARIPVRSEEGGGWEGRGKGKVLRRGDAGGVWAPAGHISQRLE